MIQILPKGTHVVCFANGEEIFTGELGEGLWDTNAKLMLTGISIVETSDNVIVSRIR